MTRILCVVFFFLLFSSAEAGYLDLAWDPNNESDLAGYRVYFGIVSNQYAEFVDVGNRTTYRLGDLTEGVRYYVAVSAYDNAGRESEYSEEVSGIPSQVSPGPVEELVVGLGSYPAQGGWVETCSEPNVHGDWIRVGWDAYNAANGETRVAAGDIDGDGTNEVVVGLGPVSGNSAVPGGWFEVFDGDGTHLAWGRVNWSPYNAANGETWPACGDLDGDGRDEIIIGLGSGGAGWVEVFDYAGGRITHNHWKHINWSPYNAANGETRPACGDLDGDGKDEIIIGFGPVAGETSLPGGWIQVMDDDAVQWGRVGWSGYNDSNGETRPACGDIDGDGKDEIIVGLGPGGAGWVELFDVLPTGLSRKNWVRVNWKAYNTPSGETRPASGDIDGDGKDEIVAGLGPEGKGYLEVLDDASSNYAHLSWPRVSWSTYNTANGESWPGVKR